MATTPDDKSMSARDVARLLSDRITELRSRQVESGDASANAFFAFLLGIVGALVLVHMLAGA